MSDQPKCVYCDQTDQNTPLVNLTYKGRPLWICSQHLRLLIHEPERLAEKLDQATQDK